MFAMAATTDAEALFRMYRGKIRRYILRMVKNQAEAEELAQETFLRAYQRRDSLRDPQAVVGWLYRIATNACIDYFRRHRPEVSLEAGETPQTDSRPGRMSSALEIAEREETSRCVQSCLEHLPDTYRTVLLLYEGESLTAAEIADMLHLKLTTVKMRLYRAHKLLREIMKCGCTVSSNAQSVPICEPKHQRIRNAELGPPLLR